MSDLNMLVRPMHAVLDGRRLGRPLRDEPEELGYRISPLARDLALLAARVGRHAGVAAAGGTLGNARRRVGLPRGEPVEEPPPPVHEPVAPEVRLEERRAARDEPPPPLRVAPQLPELPF